MEALPALLRGSLVHQLLERLDMRRGPLPTQHDVEALIERHGEPVREADVADLRDMVERFWGSELRGRLAAARRVRAELPFCFTLEPPHAGGRSLLVNGFVDVHALEDDRTLIVDYKSDRLDPDARPAEMADRDYATQRLVYALAALREGAARVEVVHQFLELPDEPASVVWEAADAADLERRLLELAGGVVDSRFLPSDEPHLELCRLPRPARDVLLAAGADAGAGESARGLRGTGKACPIETRHRSEPTTSGACCCAANLLEARQQGLPADELRATEDEAIRDVVRMQEEVGLQSATDGEFRRASWHMDFIYEIDGITRADERADGEDATTRRAAVEFTSAALKVDGKLGVSRDDLRRGLQLPRRHRPQTAVPKQTIPSPSMVHYRGGAAAIDPDVYADQDAFWGDLTSAYAEEVRRMADLGCTYLQLDDTSLAYLNDPKQREQMASRGEDSEHLHESYIKHLNEALAGRPEGMAVTTHMCRGNFRSSWAGRGRLRLRRRGAVHRPRRRRLLPGVRRRPLRAGSSHCASSRRTSWWCSAS